MEWLTDERRLSLIFSWDHCQRFLPSQIFDIPRAGFEPTQNLSPDFVKGSYAEVIATSPRRHYNAIHLQANNETLYLRLLVSTAQ